MAAPIELVRSLRMQACKIAGEQPYIHRLKYLGVESQARSHGIELAREVTAPIFGGAAHSSVDRLAGSGACARRPLRCTHSAAMV